MFEPLYLYILSATAFLIMICGIVVLWRSITYAYGDAGQFLELSGSMRGFNWGEEYSTTIGPRIEYMGQFWPKMYRIGYSLFINALRLFPLEYRFRGGQWINIFFYALCLVTFFLLIFFTFDGQLERAFLIPVALVWTFLVGARTKILYTVLAPQAEVINYFLIMASALTAHMFVDNGHIGWVLLLGLTTGLAFRNKATDIPLLFSSLVFLALVGGREKEIILFCLTFLLCNLDSLLIRLQGKDKRSYLGDILYTNSPLMIPNGSFLKRVWCQFYRAIKVIVNLYSWESLWPTAGIMLLLFPYSCWLLFHTSLCPANLFFFLFMFFYLFAASCITRNQVGSKNGTFYFGCRQVYPVFFAIAFINATACCFALINHNLSAVAVFMGAIILYLAHQGYKVLDYYFSSTIYEVNAPVFYKKPERFRVELADYIKTVDGSMVLLGYYLKWGEVYHYFQSSEQCKSIMLICTVSDQQLWEIIQKYNVTHIAVTPLTGFLAPDSGLRNDDLDSFWVGKICRREVSDKLLIYKTMYAV